MLKDYEDLYHDVLVWAGRKGILQNSDPKSQLLKTVSEVGELADAVNHEDRDEIIDAIGDIQVTLLILSELYGLNATDCLQSAYNVISKRSGEMVNGVFVKDD